MTGKGKHARRYALMWHLRRHIQEYIDAAYTPIGQRALVLLITAAILLMSNLVIMFAQLFQ